LHANRALEFLPLGLIALWVAIAAAASLAWPIQHDTVLFYYTAWLERTHGILPYRDLFEVNPPGAHAAYALITTLAPSDITFRILDLAHTLACGALLAAWMLPFGKVRALGSASILAALLLQLGPLHALQREAMLLLPILLSLHLATRLPKTPLWLRAFLIGVLHGAAATIKPPILIALPAFLTAIALHSLPPQNTPRQITHRLLLAVTCAGGGALLAPLALLGRLHATGSLAEFQFIAHNYWPLYAQLSARGHIVQSPADYYTLFHSVAFTLVRFDYALLLPISILAISSLRTHPPDHRRDFALTLTLAAAYAAYAILGRKAWPYHWIPFMVPSSIIFGLAFALPQIASARLRAAGLAFTTMVILAHYRIPPGLPQIMSAEPMIAKNGNPERIANHLKLHLRPADTIQPLDMAEGALHAMWLAQARPATRFIYNAPLYHHTDTVTVQTLRARFLTELNAAAPRYVLRFPKHWRPQGPRTEATWQDLETTLARDYTPTLSTKDFTLLERIRK